MKFNLSFLLAAGMVLTSCNMGNEKFTPNKDNPYMEGKWIITEVDNSDALVSKQTLFFSIIEEDYVDGNYMVFKPGDQFFILSEQGDTLDKGQYGVSGNNDHLQLYSPGDDKLITYEITPASETALKLNPVSPGVLTGLVIEKKE